jgi:hypothetical protein
MECDFEPSGGIIDAGLRLLVERWKRLPEATKAAIVQLTETAGP